MAKTKLGKDLTRWIEAVERLIQTSMELKEELEKQAKTIQGEGKSDTNKEGP